MAIPSCKVDYEIFTSQSLLWAVMCPAKNLGNAIFAEEQELKHRDSSQFLLNMFFVMFLSALEILSEMTANLSICL